MKKLTVLLADDHVMVAEGIKNILSKDYEILDIVEDGQALLQKAKQLKPDLIVSDISMPRLNGIDAITKLKEHSIDSKIILLTMHPEVKYAIRAFDAGADGYLLKHSAPEELVTAITTVLKGKTYITSILAGELMDAYKSGNNGAEDPLSLLTSRQREVLQLLAESHSAKEIANMLNVSSRTVEFHKYKMIEVLKLKNANELVKFALENGITTK